MASSQGTRGSSISSLFLLAAGSILAAQCQAFSNGASQQPLGNDVKPEWKECGTLNNHTVECTRLEVPMDQFKDSAPGRNFSLPLIRLLGTNSSASGGRSILLNPGGPGGSGVNFLWRAGQLINKIVGEDFDLVSFDPRGVNSSIPQASCYATPEQRAEEIENIPWHAEFESGDMFTNAENTVKACDETMGESGHYINTPQTAADMNTILDFLGQEKMYYWGFSYGTTLGQTYAQLFPERVERLIIDGVSNLDDWYNAYLDAEAYTDTDKIFSGFLKECFDAKDNCPLNDIKGKSFATASDLETYVNDYLIDLEEEPIPVYINNSNFGSVTRRNLVTNGIFPALYKPAAWPTLARNLAELFSGNPTPAYNAYSDSWISAIIGDESGAFVILNDNWKTGPGAPVHGIKAIQNYTLSMFEMSQLISRYGGSENFNRASWSMPKTHDFHPHYYPEFPKVKTAAPILVLSTTFDPVCPLVSALSAYNSFEGAGFVEQKSYGHCSISMPSVCTAKHVKRYFNEGRLPEADSKCGIDGEYFPTSVKPPSTAQISDEDAELLTSLQELAAMDIFEDLPRKKILAI